MRPLPAISLFKFVKREHMNSFFDSGAIRIGTVRQFRDLDEFGTARGDAGEGRHHVQRNNIGNTIDITPDFVNEPILNEFITVPPDIHNAKMTGGTFIVERQDEDCYVFCTSNTFSEELFLRMHKEFEVDACYEIQHVHFFAAIFKQMQDRSSFAFCTDVVYTDERIDYQHPAADLPPSFTKQRPYDWQRESRAVWEPKNRSATISHLDLRALDARQFARPFALMQGGSELGRAEIEYLVDKERAFADILAHPTYPDSDRQWLRLQVDNNAQSIAPGVAPVRAPVVAAATNTARPRPGISFGERHGLKFRWP